MLDELTGWLAGCIVYTLSELMEFTNKQAHRTYNLVDPNQKKNTVTGLSLGAFELAS